MFISMFTKPAKYEALCKSTVRFLYRYSVVSLPPSSTLKEHAFLSFRATYSAYCIPPTYLQTSPCIPNLRACLSTMTKDPLSMEVYAASLGNPKSVS